MPLAPPPPPPPPPSRQPRPRTRPRSPPRRRPPPPPEPKYNFVCWGHSLYFRRLPTKTPAGFSARRRPPQQ
eukprot:1455772-Pyramimonas_sp.AAC.1